MNKKSFTIKDIAEMAEVSIGTVDRVLHNRGNVSKKSLDKVNAVLSKIDYEPCPIAKALSARQKNIIIGFTYPDIDCSFWNEIKFGIEYARKMLSPYGVSIEVETSSSYAPDDQKTAIKRLIEKNVSCVIIGAVESFTLTKIEDFIPENIPFATIINKTTSTRTLFHVGPDDLKTGEIAAKLLSLFGEGKKLNTVILASNYGFIGTQLRVAGFISKVMQDISNVTITQTVNCVGFDDGELNVDMKEKVLSILKKYPDTNAFYIINGVFDGAVKAIVESGRSDIKLIAYEYNDNLRNYIDNNYINATIYQHPAKQFVIASRIMYKYLTEKVIPGSSFITETSIFMKESYSTIKVGLDEFIEI